MAKEITKHLAGKKVVLSSGKALFLPLDDIMVISDLHLGKATHFQKNGLAIPGEMARSDLHRLGHLIKNYQPATVVFAGDLFHAHHNEEWNIFLHWKKKWDHISFHLVKGNHDRLNETTYSKSGLVIHQNQFDLNSIRIIHKPGSPADLKLEISGHIHPGIRLKGKGRQKMRLPCFVVRGNQIILPAFGQFTGLDTGFISSDDEIYVIAENEIVLYST